MTLQPASEVAEQLIRDCLLPNEGSVKGRIAAAIEQARVEGARAALEWAAKIVEHGVPYINDPDDIAFENDIIADVLRVTDPAAIVGAAQTEREP